jgi:apolipoprotein D and lipocalin family protein
MLAMNRLGYLFLVTLISVLVSSCVGIPDGVQPVEGFEVNRYLGKWYEIARLDHSFERGLQNVTAEYSLLEDGGIRVINSGYSTRNNKITSAEGKAYFANDPDEGYLKVSFFGPFYGSYVVFELDKERYDYAFITSYNKSYLWLLSRTPMVSNELVDRFVNRARELGFNTDDLIFVEHDVK